MHQRIKGFSLIELMIVLVIVAILAWAAVSSYRGQTLKSNRSAAESYMKEVAGKQERFLLDNRQYAATMIQLGEVAPAHVADNYTISVGDDDAASPVPGYLITATPIGGQLADDTVCGTLTLNHRGTQTPATPSCWK